MAIDFPNAPTVGQVFTAANKTWQWNGSYWDLVDTTGPETAWVDYTPTIIQGTATNIAKTVVYSRWTRVGNTINWNFQFNITGAGAASHVAITLPVNVRSAATHAMGVGSISDASAGGVNSAGFWYPVNAGQIGLVAHGATNAFGISPAVVLASGDTIYGSLTYEAA